MGGTVTGQRFQPAPLGGDVEAVRLATLYPESENPVALRGGWCVITPGWAEAMARTAVSRLPLEAGTIRHMADDMRGLRWRATGEAIVLDQAGRVLDGRKRLAACVAADLPFVALMLVGVGGDVIDTVNNLRSRRLSDILHIQGEANYRSFATMLQILWRMRDGGYDRHGAMGSDQELLALLEAHPRMRESLAYAGGKGRTVRLPLFAALHFLFHRIDHGRAVEFFRALVDDGIAATTDRPERRLREGHPARAVNDVVLHARTVGEDLDRNREIGAAMLTLAWNTFVGNGPVKSLRWAPVDGDGVAQLFPAIAGWTPSHALVDAAAPVSRRRNPGPDPNETAVLEPATLGLEDGLQAHPRAAEVWEAAFPDGLLPEIGLRMIGPKEAADLLERNAANRGKVAPIIARYARDMAAGNFRSLNGQTVKLGRHGRLLDSQHRMEAVVRSQARLPFVVVSGLDDRAFDAMDRGDTKTFAQVLRERGQGNAGTIAAAARLQWLWEHDQFRRLHGLSPSVPELDDVLRRHPALRDSLDFNNRLRDLVIPAGACWLEFQLKQSHSELAGEFLDRLATGEDLKRGNPILLLRRKLDTLHKERLKRDRGQKKSRGGAEDDEAREPAHITQCALAILAFNAWKSGRTLQTLVWRGVSAEGFPAIDASLLDHVVPPLAKGGSAGRRRKPAVAAP